MKNTRGTLFLLASLLGSTSVAAQPDRWEKVVETDDVTIFIDRVSLRREGERVRVWTKWLFATERELPGLNRKKYRSAKSLDAYRCDQRTVGNVQLIHYSKSDATGEIVNTLTVAEGLADFSEVVPETIGEDILTRVCGG